MISDLNILWPQRLYSVAPSPNDINNVKNILAMLIEFGYTHVALNFLLESGAKLPAKDICPINLGLFKEFSDRLKIFKRITIIVNDPAQFQNISRLQSNFDIIAIQPTTEKALQLATTNLDIDLISLDLGSRLPCYLRHKTLGAAISRGVKFEISYSGLIPVLNSQGTQTPSQTRRNFISNLQMLIRSSRKRGLIITSGANAVSQLRSSYDIINIMCVLGMDNMSARNSIHDVPIKVLSNGILRNASYKQTIRTTGELLLNDDNVKEKEKTVQDVVVKKKRTGTNILERQLKKKRKQNQCIN